MDGGELLTQTVNVDWAFSRGPFKRKNNRRRYVSHSGSSNACCFFNIICILMQDCFLEKGTKALQNDNLEYYFLVG